jgi:cytoskeletal protein RodZ
MGSFGERLRREREMRGITIEEIAEATKIGSRNLRALEDEKFDLLPGGIFNKGFVRAYSKFLGLDEEQAVADYIAAESSFRDAASDGLDVHVENSPHASLAVPVTIVVLLAIAGGGFGGWKYYQKRAAQQEAEQIAAASKPAAAVAPPAQPVAPPSTPASAGQDSSASPTTTQPTNAAGTTPAASPATTAPEVPASSDSAATGGFVVQLKANQDSWVSAKADGKSVFSETLKATNERTLHARDRIVLTLGNAAGVQVSYNGKDQTFDRAAGKVKTLVFTAHGLQPDAPEQR